MSHSNWTVALACTAVAFVVCACCGYYFAKPEPCEPKPAAEASSSFLNIGQLRAPTPAQLGEGAKDTIHIVEGLKKREERGAVLVLLGIVAGSEVGAMIRRRRDSGRCDAKA
jgi:hypothetical protein